ncbi:hypothetical protein GJAV_G00135540 [Gymnothorax javanicus]|nr:hypothetical protein GJAV_G00135540 [Gymnothorax javanicus]
MALSGKIALVTGAGKGLGKGFSDILLKNGAKVAMLDQDLSASTCTIADFHKVYGEDSTFFIPCDVSSDEQLKGAFQKTAERFGRIDIVCNNAGIADEHNWETMVDVNLKGVIRGTYLALQYMKKENGGAGGVIVNISSMAGLGPLLVSPAYTATKHGIVGFTRAMAGASEVSGYGVRINALCPSYVKTPLLEALEVQRSSAEDSPLMLSFKQLKEEIGLLQVPDVAEKFLHLVTDEDNNGAVMMVTRNGSAYLDFPRSVEGVPRVPIP